MSPINRRRFIRTVAGGTILGTVATGTAVAAHQTWTAQLRPVSGTGSNARGSAEFKYIGQRPGGNERLEFGFQATSLSSPVAAAHIHHDAHSGHSGAFGPILVWLYPDATENEQSRGNFFAADGQFHDDDLTGNEAVDSLEDLVTELKAEKTTIRVHTTENTAGEIVGEIS